MTKQADISRFHRTLLNKMTDTEDRSKVKKRSGVDSEGLKVEERSGEEDRSVEDEEREKPSRTSRLSSGGENSVGSPVESTADEPGVRGGEEALPPGTQGDQEMRESRPPTADSDVGAPVAEDTEAAALFPPTIDKEKRRKIAATKRANDESLQSARDRYLARKRAKLTAPVISDD